MKLLFIFGAAIVLIALSALIARLMRSGKRSSRPSDGARHDGAGPDHGLMTSPLILGTLASPRDSESLDSAPGDSSVHDSGGDSGGGDGGGGGD